MADEYLSQEQLEAIKRMGGTPGLAAADLTVKEDIGVDPWAGTKKEVAGTRDLGTTTVYKRKEKGKEKGEEDKKGGFDLGEMFGNVGKFAGGVGGAVKEGWDKMSNDQKMLALLAVGRVAAGSQGAENVGDYTAFATGAVTGRAAQIAKEREQAHELKLAGGKAAAAAMPKPGEMTDIQKQQLGVFKDITASPSFTDAIKKGNVARKVMAQEGMSEEDIAKYSQDPQVLSYYTFKGYMPQMDPGVSEMLMPPALKGKQAPGGVIAAPKNITADKSGVQWEVVTDAAGKPIGKKRVK